MTKKPLLFNVKVDEYGPNYVVLKDELSGDQMLFSYGSPVALETPNGFTYLDERFYKFSPTTGKHRNRFLNEDMVSLNCRIKNKDAAILPYFN